jgi:hypothetical protein
VTQDKYLAKLASLLRQAERTDNENEAEAFMAAAQRLATATSIDLAVARAYTARRERRTSPVSKRIEIGQPGKRGLRTYVQLFIAIARANDLTCDLASNSTYVIAYGFETDIEVCEALYASLVVQMVRASDAYLRSGRYREETYLDYEPGRFGRWHAVEKPVHGSTARISFQTSFAERIGERLVNARREATEEALRAEAQRTDRTPGAPGTGTPGSGTPGTGTPGTGTPGTELVLQEKALEIADFYAQASKARGAWRGWAGSGRVSTSAQRAGRRAADAASTTPSTALPGQREALPS